MVLENEAAKGGGPPGREAPGRWRDLVEALPQFVWTARADGSGEFINQQWLDYTGIPLSDQLGEGWLDVLHPDDRARTQAAWRKAVAEGERYEVEYRLRAKDGAYRWFRAVGAPLRSEEDGSILYWLGTTVDIDNHKRREERLAAAVAESAQALKEAQRRADYLAQAKSEFLAVISHEIRTPLNGVIGMAHLMADTPLTPEQQEYMETIQSSAQALLAIINDVLDFSKIEVGRIKLEDSEFDLRTVVEESLELVSWAAAAKDLKLSLEVEENVPPTVMGDAGRLLQILLSLLSNAVKFTERGSITVSVGCEDVRDKFLIVRFRVSDTGIGVPPEQQGAIFQAFTQADNSLARRFGGAGLGLSIAKRLVELMGGSIGVSSEVGHGATFWFKICLKPGTALQAGPRPARGAQLDEKASLRNRFAGRGARVLLADDNISNQQAALGILQRMGLRADAVADGAEALAALDTVPYDLIFMDVRMPNMDGLEATRRIREAESRVDAQTPARRLPIIGMTASAMQGDRESCLEAGMNDYIAKPVSPRGLAAVLEKWLPKTPGAAAGPAEAARFDMNALLNRLMGDRKLAATVLDGFLNDMPKQLQALEKFVAAGSAQSVEQQAHRIKGALATIGGESMRAVAAEIETAAQSGDLAVAETRLPDLNHMFGKLREAIARHHETPAR